VDSLESFQGVEMVSLWSVPGSNCSSAASGVLLANGFGHAGSLGSVPVGELDELLSRLRYLVNWEGFRG